MKRAEWESLISEQRESGLTVSDFCEMRGINRKTFSCQKSVLKSATSARSFVQIGSASIIELILRNGVTMRVPLMHLAEVLKVLNG